MALCHFDYAAGVFQLKKNAIQAASCTDPFRLLTTDINVEVALQTGFSIPNVSRNHIADAEVDPIALKKVKQCLVEPKLNSFEQNEVPSINVWMFFWYFCRL